MNKCDRCLHSRAIVSENGYHSTCCLPTKQAIECMTNRKSHLSIFYWKGEDYASASGEQAEEIVRKEIEEAYYGKGRK